ncbi:BCNT-domain-containing protein, partial [Metschnikowia bicuspidata var. bicuspidata NRRL YB-4993]
DENDEDYDENNDDDYDPLKKADVQDDDSEMSEDEAQPDYSAISTDVSQVRTRGQRYQEKAEQKNGKTHQDGLLEDSLKVDVDEIFQSLQTLSADDWARMVRHDDATPEPRGKDEKPAAALAENTHPEAEEKIRIFTTYTFAGKLVRESKFVDANSAEAKAYLNSTNSLALQEQSAGPRKSYVPVLRKVAGSDEEKQLRIKLKRPSLIDKFLMGDKQNKLTTLEKSRLDWASFVDKKKLKDDLAIHNKGGYLEKQDFLGRVEAKRDTQYQQARELDRQRQWQ